MFSISAIIFADVFNLVVGGTILCVICFPLVGIIYDRGDAPVIGSILYGVFVLINSWALSWSSSCLKEADLKLLLIRYGLVLIFEILVLIGIRYFKESYFI